MNIQNFEEWLNCNEQHINNLFNIFVNNMKNIDKNSIDNKNEMFKEFAQFIYNYSTKHKSPYNLYIDHEDYYEKNTYKYARFD